MPHKIEPSRNPIQDKLLGEHNHFRRGRGFPNSRDRLQDIIVRGTWNRQTTKNERISRLKLIPITVAISPGPHKQAPVFPCLLVVICYATIGDSIHYNLLW